MVSVSVPSASGASGDEITRILTEGQVAELTDAFNAFDRDKDGRITYAEISLVLENLGLNPSDAQVKQMVMAADMDGDGCIDLDEFLQLHAAAGKLQDVDATEMLKEVFEVFDKDKNGSISAEELHDVLTFLEPDGEPVTVEDCRRMIQRVDANGDGVVDFLEFAKMMLATDLAIAGR